MLPIGIQTLGNIRARNCYYVDKTSHVLRLVGEGTHYFLSRPRRFGKSLLVDTLKELFKGNGDLFQGLDNTPGRLPTELTRTLPPDDPPSDNEKFGR